MLSTIVCSSSFTFPRFYSKHHLLWHRRGSASVITAAARRSYEQIINEAYSYSTRSGNDDGLVILQNSGFVAHVVVQKHRERPILEALQETVDSCLKNKTMSVMIRGQMQDNVHIHTPEELLSLGAVWYLPPDSPRDPSLGVKPVRLAMEDTDRVLQPGSYLRVHHTPRRFPAVDRYDWGKKFNDAEFFNPGNHERPGVVVAEDESVGYRIIMKPEGIPVHSTVDNHAENVAFAVQRDVIKRQNITEADLKQQRENIAKRQRGRTKKEQKRDQLAYVSTPQRLDHDTVGLLTVATKPAFASYFSKILRHKTSSQLSENEVDIEAKKTKSKVVDAVSKSYKCLVCIAPASSSITEHSMYDEVKRLQSFSDKNETIVHYLEPSIRAPKNFATNPGNSSWAQCLLQLKFNNRDVYPVKGSKSAEELTSQLWGLHANIPKKCIAVAEVEVALLTGRTHQIRGQMSSLGFPLVGDVLYGGAETESSTNSSKMNVSGYHDCEKLALQCSELSFLLPNTVQGKRGITYVPSRNRETFRVGAAWWTPPLEEYKTAVVAVDGDDSSSLEYTSSLKDQAKVAILKAVACSDGARSAMASSMGKEHYDLPPRVILEPGVNKYILIKATSNVTSGDDGSLWFVKSASPQSCGGPYHADVARELIDDLFTRGYYATVVGGGRIDYVEEIPHAHVYGFSYGFGKGDHLKVTQIIEEWSENQTIATFNNDDSLY